MSGTPFRPERHRCSIRLFRRSARGRLVIWAEASPKGMARLLRVNPSLRGLFETVTIEPMSAAGTLLACARNAWTQMAKRADIRFEPDCAEVARDTVSQYMGSGALPGSVLLMLKLTAVRAEKKDEISSRQILETLSQLSGLPLAHTRHQGAARSHVGARILQRAYSRAGRGGRSRCRSHRHAQGRTE